MGVSYHIDMQEQIVWTRAYGSMENDDLVLHGHKVKKDPAFDPGFQHIIDLSEITKNRINLDILKEAALVSPFHSQSYRAIIVPRDADTRFVEKITDIPGITPGHLRAFRNEEDALQWLKSLRVKA